MHIWHVCGQQWTEICPNFFKFRLLPETVALIRRFEIERLSYTFCFLAAEKEIVSRSS